jgi:hypothetical protein
MSAPNYLVMEVVEGPTLAERIKAARFRWTKHSGSRARLVMHSTPRTTGASFTAI